LAYTQYTLASLGQEISVSLQDPNRLYWSAEEIYYTINEALLLWGGLTSYWRERGALATVANTSIYDLSSSLPTLRARTINFADLTKQIQYHLIEPPNGVTGSGMSTQFSIDQILSSLSRKRNEFVLDSRLPLTSATLASSFPPDGRVQLDQAISLIARASWTDGPTTVITPLYREDEFSAQHLIPDWNNNPNKPIAYSLTETQPTTLQLVPPPLSSGALNLIYVNTLTLDPLADPSPFLVPDEFSPAIKWASLYELLSTESEGYDPIRAKYCLERYNAIVDSTSLHRSIFNVRLNDVPLSLDTLNNLDAAYPFWQNKRGRPTIAATAYDILALADPPNSIYGLSVDVVRSAPISYSLAPASYIQLGREDMPYIFDYCRHALSFKLGGDEFTSTMPLYDNFLRGAGQRNRLLSAKTRYLTPIFSQAQIQEGVIHAA
jgi:hypothetical protein